jgi:hypothetical protein
MYRGDEKNMSAYKMKLEEVQHKLRMYHMNSDVHVGQVVWVRIQDAKGLYEMPVEVV